LELDGHGQTQPPTSTQENREPGAGGVDPPLAVATLNGGCPTSRVQAEHGYSWFVGGWAGVRMKIAANK